jgi:hypothetical protein
VKPSTAIVYLSGMGARCSNDLAVRRKIDAVVHEVRKEIAKAALAMADENGSSPVNASSSQGLGRRRDRITLRSLTCIKRYSATP